MSQGLPPETTCRYGQSGCSAADLDRRNGITVGLGGETPLLKQSPSNPLWLCPCCLLKLLFLQRWLLKGGLRQIASAGWGLGCDGRCYPPLQRERRC